VNAAAIADTSFDPTSQTPTRADGIQNCIRPDSRALIMSTVYDDALPLVSQKPPPDHGDPWKELGISNVAPAVKYFPCRVSFNMSDTVNKANQDGAENVHTAYYYIPKVLDIMNTYLNFDFDEADKSGIADSVTRINEPEQA
jgi:hypothetical protein